MAPAVLITGVSRSPGAGLAAQLAGDPSIERIIGVDNVPPEPGLLTRLGRTEFVLADIHKPQIATVLTEAGVSIVVHAAPAPSRPDLTRGATKELNVIGTMQLLAACQKADLVRRLVVASSTAVYGSSGADPAVFTEDMGAERPLRGYARDALDVEGYVRGFGRRRPDVVITVARFADIVGPGVDTALTRYLRAPIVPTSLGFDPRIQLLHESDAQEVLRLAALSDRPGTVNVAGAGVLLLSQVLRRVGRLRLPVPGPALAAAGRLVGNAATIGVCNQAGFLDFGRVVDTTRLRTTFGYTPRFTTAQALASLFGRTPPADGAAMSSRPRVVAAGQAAG
jgi:UDP-glucose 4-epimerase